MNPMKKIPKMLDVLYPMLIGIFALGCTIYFRVDYTIHKFEKVLDTMIIFSSIVTGFLAALLGILVSIRNSEIVKTLFSTKTKGIIKYYFYETFILGFSVVVVSGAMYVLTDYDFDFTIYFFYFWIMIVFWFFPSTYRIVSVLLSIFFRANNNNRNQRPSDNKVNAEERNEMKERLRKKDAH